MNNSKRYDIVVIGAGSGGLTAAVGFNKIGKKVLLIEREHMGGECTNTGCIPSKALLHHAKTYYKAQKIAGTNDKTVKYREDAFKYVKNVVDGILAEEQPEYFEGLGIDVVMGEASFAAPCTLSVGATRYTFKKAVIATGSHPRALEIPGLAKEYVLTNQNVFDLKHIPKDLLVVGGGPVGLELGQAFAMLGSTVTIVDAADGFAKKEDPATAKILKDSFNALGIKYIEASRVKEARGTKAIIVPTQDASDKGGAEVSFDAVLVAIGREPNLPEGLEKAGVIYTEHGITVNTNGRTKNKDVYAVGDVVASPHKFTHVADDNARAIVTNVATHGIIRASRKKCVPRVTYTSPEIGSVGRSSEDAEEKFGEQAVVRIEVPYADNDRAKTDSTSSGLLVIVARRITGTIVGASVVGEHAGELIGLLTVAMQHDVSLWKLRRTIYPYPTYSQLVRKAGDFFFAHTISNLKADVSDILRKNAPRLVAFIFWMSIVAAFTYYKSVSNLTHGDIFRILFTFVTETPWGPLIYVVLYTLRPIIFFPATLLTALSGALFGLWWGLLFTVIGENASANLAYWIGRFFGKDLKLEDSFIGSWIKRLREHPFSSVLFMRLFYVPFDLTNYGSGILKVRWQSYALATFIGIIPGLTVFVALGAGIKDIQNFELSYSAFNFTNISIGVVIFILTLILARFLRRWKPAT